MSECAKTHLQPCRISKFFRGRTPGPPGEERKGAERGMERMERAGKGRGREGREERKGGREGRGGVDPWPLAPKTIIRHCEICNDYEYFHTQQIAAVLAVDQANI